MDLDDQFSKSDFIRVALAALLCVLILGVCARQPSYVCPITPDRDPQPSIAPLSALEPVSSQPIPTSFLYNHASSVIEAPNGDLLAAWGAGTEELAPDCVIVLSRRRHGESQWSNPVVIADKPGDADANPVLFLDDAGLLHLYYVEMFGNSFCLGHVMEKTSTDNGLTWSEPRDALKSVCTMIRNHPIITQSGRWILPAYQQAIYQSQFWISDNKGLTWTAGGALFTPSANNLQPAVVELSDGSLYSLMRTGGGNFDTWEGRSSDCGNSWQLRQRPELPNPNSGLDLLRLSTGHLVLAFNPSKSERTPLALSYSSDEGKTWSPPQTISDGDPQLSYPSLCQTKDGRIHLTYSDRLMRIHHVELSVPALPN